MKQTIIEKAIKSIKDLQNQLTSSSQKLGLAQAMDILEGYKEMEKLQSHSYAEFAIRCDRMDMKILNFEDFVKLETFKK